MLIVAEPLRQSKKPTGSQRNQIVWIFFGILCIVLVLISTCNRSLPEPVSKASAPPHSSTTIQHTQPFYQNFNVFVEDVVSELRNAPVIEKDPHALLVAFPHASMDGSWLEFGVFGGGTIKTMAEAYHGSGTVYGFDSFEGLPEKWRNGKWFDQGAFDRKGVPPFDETEKIKWVKGWYEKSIPPFVENRSHEKFPFIHIDCDLYSCTRTVFKELDAWLVPGVVIVFDELVNYPEYRDHEIKALFELLQDRPDLGFRIIGTSTRDVRLDLEKDIVPQAAAIQLCANGSMDCMLSDGFRVFERYSTIQRNP